MKNTARKKKLRKVEPVVQLTLVDVIRADLREFVIAAGTAAIGVMLEHERAQLVGPRYAHLPGREAHRTGFAPGELVLGGRRVQNLVRRLRDEHPGAAASLDEGLDETITVKRLGLSSKLERQLATTNAIENLIGSLRRIAGRVRRWRNARMMMRWTVAAIADAATRFRCVMGTRDGMNQLVRALKDHESAVAIVSPRKQAA